MPCARDNQFRLHFTYNAATDTSTGQIQTEEAEDIEKICAVQIKGTHNTNLKQHIETVHSNVFAAIEAKRKNSMQSSLELEQPLITSFLSPASTNVKLSHCIVETALLKLVTVNGQPFTYIDDDSTRAIIDLLLDGFGNRSVVSSFTIKALVMRKAKEFKDLIAKSVRNEFISLKVDSATYMGKSFLGVTIQLQPEVTDFKMLTIACVQMKKRHTAENLKEEIMNILKQYDIPVLKVYSVTSDNGANFVKAISLLRDTDDEEEQLPHEVIDIENDSENKNDDTWDDVTIECDVEDVNDYNPESDDKITESVSIADGVFGKPIGYGDLSNYLQIPYK